MTRADKEIWLTEKCSSLPSCCDCPAHRNVELTRACFVKSFDSMTEEQLDRLISYFDRRREAKLCAVQELCNQHEVCTDCPVHNNHATTDLCEKEFGDMSDEELDAVLNCFKNAEKPAECSDHDKVLRHKELCDKIHSLYKKKNHDYGDSFGQSFRDYGPLAGLVRMEDKFNRLKTLVRGAGQEVKDESIMDTLMDLANYAIMTMLEMGE